MREIVKRWNVAHSRFVSSSGSPTKSVHVLRHTALGDKELVETGKTNMYEYIQSFKDECSLEKILARASADPSVLQARQGVFIDSTGLPRTLSELMDVMSTAEKYYNDLQPAEKARYATFNDFLSNYIPDLVKTVQSQENGVSEPIPTPTPDEGGIV